jgi:IrrE N-terminal-like domain
MPGPVTDPRAQALLDRFHEAYAAPDLPVPVEAIAEDLFGLYVEEADDLECSGLLLPAERRVVLRASESESRQRFTLAHELGHWVCQVKQGHQAPVYCRAVDVEPTADRALEREANLFAAELLMPEPVVRKTWRMAASCHELASWFDVSNEAMGWRLFSLGLATRPV